MDVKLRQFGLIICAVSFLLPSLSWGEESKGWLTPVVGEGYGVQVKEERTTDNELRMIKDAGFSYVRFVIPWSVVEKEDGLFKWGHFDPFVKRLRKFDLGAVIVIGGGHPTYTGVMKAPEDNVDHLDTVILAPSTIEHRKAFTRYAAETIKHFGTKNIVWEIWNEPDQERFWAPKVNVDNYAALANDACWAMREVEPSAKIIGPGMADTPGQWGVLLPGFLGKVLQSPVADCLDAISVHPYRDYVKPPELVSDAYTNLREFIKAYTKEGKEPLRVLSSEWGFSLSYTSEREQAAFLLRSLMLNTLNNVPLSIWYEWRDEYEGSLDDVEAHFGLLTFKQEEKASYKAVKSFLPPLVGAKLETRLNIGNEEDYVLKFKKGNKSYHLVYWSADSDTDTRIIYRCGDKGETKEVALSFMPQRADCKNDVPLISAVHYMPKKKVKP